MTTNGRIIAEANVRAESTIAEYIKEHERDDNPPVSWTWAPWSGPLRDGFEDIVLTTQDGKSKVTTAADLRSEMQA